MSRKRKHLDYTYPGSKKAAKEQRLIWWTLTLLVGAASAVLMGVLFYLKDRF
jgi:hypothetical protein